MHSPGSPVETHYSRQGIFETILQQLHTAGIEKVTRKDIAGIDEFHVRGAEVSLELAYEAGFTKKTKVLDIGCGIGGPCRMLADEFQCKVTGVDITEEYIRTARLLSELTGLEKQTNFIQADALHLPFNNECFDVAWTQHVQMNIADKIAFYNEMKRVVAKGGRFIYYDIFKKNDDALYYPVPWADNTSISFLITTSALHALLTDIGFTRVHTKDQTTPGIAFFNRMFEKLGTDKSAKPGLQVLIGDNAKEKLHNVLENLTSNRIELQSGIYIKG